MRLAYSSEAEDRMDRLWRKQRKLENKLIEGEIKPKAMHWRTFEQIQSRIDEVEEQKDVLFTIRAAGILGLRNIADLLK